jgi:hypothetical protein
MNCRRLRSLSAAPAAACLVIPACGRDAPQAEPPIQLVAGPSPAPSGLGSIAMPAAADVPSVIAFPPRNEPFAFREGLERKYLDGLRRSPSSTNVDLEGDIVWTQEYLRYRVNQCDHATAARKVLDQIDGRGIAPVCTGGPTGLWDGSAPTYWNAPFTMDVAFRGTQIAGTYRDQHDSGTLRGIYVGGNTIVINVYFGDGGLIFTGEFDAPDKI